MKQDCKICVICHLYYQNLWPEIKNYLSNLTKFSNFDLYVTCNSSNQELFDDIQNSFNTSGKVNIDIIENLGADIYPFIYELNKINLDDYDIVFKLHTKHNVEYIKQKINNCLCGKNLWRDFMLTSILSEKNIPLVIKSFKENKKIGCIGFEPLLITISNKNKEYFYNKYVQELNLKKLKTYKFYGGTIFAIKAELLKCLQHKYYDTDFINNQNTKFPAICYAIEDLLGYIVEAQDHIFYDLHPIQGFIIKLFSHKSIAPYIIPIINKFFFKKQIPPYSR